MNEICRVSTPPHTCCACIVQYSLGRLVRNTESQFYFKPIDSPLSKPPKFQPCVSPFFENTCTNVSKTPGVEAFFLWVGVECYIISEKKNERRRGRLEEQAQFGDFPGTISPIFPADTRYLSLSFLSQ